MRGLLVILAASAVRHAMSFRYDHGNSVRHTGLGCYHSTTERCRPLDGDRKKQSIASALRMVHIPDLMKDMLVVSLSNGVSDGIAQFTEKKKFRKDNDGDSGEADLGIDLKRSRRFLMYGFLDGIVLHNWIIILEFLVKTIGDDEVWGTAERVVLDQFVFTPFWCIWFISCMTLISRLDGTGFNSLRSNVKAGYFELLFLTWMFFFPVSIIVYGSIPIDSRVAAFSTANVLYTVLTSIWLNLRLGEAQRILKET